LLSQEWGFSVDASDIIDYGYPNTEIKDFLGSDQAQQVDMLKNYVNGVSTN
jgi:hypothetical protein